MFRFHLNNKLPNDLFISNWVKFMKKGPSQMIHVIDVFFVFFSNFTSAMIFKRRVKQGENF